MELIAGSAKVNITPPVDCPMAGYGGRTSGAEGVRDDLWARALYLSDGVTEVALVSVEMCGLACESASAIRSGVEARAGIPGSHVFLSATHTHSGPVYHRGESELGNRNLASTEDKICGAVLWAKRRAQPARAGFGRSSVQCGINRREMRNGRMVLGINPDGPVYPYADFLHIVGEGGATEAVWFCHPCHGVVMGSSNYLISGDFAGAASRYIEGSANCTALFANGCAGNINSLPHQGTFADVDRLGRRLAAAVVQGLTHLETLEEPTAAMLSSRQLLFRLPIEEAPSTAEAEAGVRAAEAEVAAAEAEGELWRRYRARQALRRAAQRLEASRFREPLAGLPISVQVVTIGDSAIVGIPAEVFVELGMAIQSGSPFRRTIVVAYTNGSLGYLPNREAFALGGYEIDARARHLGLGIAEEAGDVLVSQCLQGLAEAWHDRSMRC